MQSKKNWRNEGKLIENSLGPVQPDFLLKNSDVQKFARLRDSPLNSSEPKAAQNPRLLNFGLLTPGLDLIILK